MSRRRYRDYYRQDFLGYDYSNPYRVAEKRVHRKLEFWRSLGAFFTVNIILIGIYLTSSFTTGGLEYPWFLWPLGIWSVLLVIDFISAYVIDSVRFERQAYEEEMRRMGVQPQNYGQTPVYPTYAPPMNGEAVEMKR